MAAHVHVPAAPVLVLIFLLLTSILTSSSDSDTTTLEIQALTTLKQSLQDPLNALATWQQSTSSAPCDWLGVTYSSTTNPTTTRHVTELRLPNLHLSGTLPSQLSDLRYLHYLRRLNLRSNSLNGTIPPALLQSATQLRFILVQSNLLSGPIPDHISNLTSLLVLNLSDNRLSGAITTTPFPNTLRFLDLSRNSFSGPMQRDFAPARWPLLQHLFG